MGWARTFLLGDIGNRLDIQDTEREIDDLRSRIRGQWATDAHQDARLQQLEARVESLQLVLGALARLIVAKGILAQDDLEHLIEMIDSVQGTDDTEPARG